MSTSRKTKTRPLYFEGAGFAPQGEVENCRIITAFHDDKGNPTYLEMSGFEVTEYNARSLQRFKNAGQITSCYYIPKNSTDEKILFDYNTSYFEYTKENILRRVNHLGCSFDEVVILPKLSGYRVHNETGGKNFADEFHYDPIITARREEIQQHYYNIEKAEGIAFPNMDIWVDDVDTALLHVMRRFKDYNRHWIIDASTEDWQSTVTQTPLYSPGGYCFAE